MAAKITLNSSVTWTLGVDQVKLGGSQTNDQIGTEVSERTQDFTDTTTQIDLNTVTGDKYFGVKNATEKSTNPDSEAAAAEDAANTLYVDSVTPVVKADAVFKIPPGQVRLIETQVDTWYGITDTGGAAHAIVGAVQK